jgi:hypothetical protein
MKNKNILLATLLVVLSAAFRVINARPEFHFWNLAPIVAMGLFSGAILKDKRLAFMLPLLAMLCSDVFFQLFTATPGFYGINQAFVYGAMLIITLFGTTMGQPKALKVGGYSIAGTAIFFVLTNFGMWVEQLTMPAGQRMYSGDLAGLGQTFAAALPFYQDGNAIIGDLIFSGILFGAYALLKSRTTVKSVSAARI